MGDKAEARALFKQAIESGDVVALNGYAGFLYYYGEHGEFGDAIECGRQRVAAGETGALALRSLPAALLLRDGAVGEATELVRRLRATGDEQVRWYADRLTEEYKLPG